MLQGSTRLTETDTSPSPARPSSHVPVASEIAPFSRLHQFFFFCGLPGFVAGADPSLIGRDVCRRRPVTRLQLTAAGCRSVRPVCLHGWLTALVPRIADEPSAAAAAAGLLLLLLRLLLLLLVVVMLLLVLVLLMLVVVLLLLLWLALLL